MESLTYVSSAASTLTRDELADILCYALALANEDGFLVAGTGGGYNLDWLAALGPVCAAGAPANGSLETLIENVTGGEDLYASAVKIGDDTLYLTSIGARVPRQKEAAETLQRILAN